MQALRICILGGGITGLAAAHRCRELAAEQDVPITLTVLERSARIGGCIETQSKDGFLCELGPDSLVTEKPAAVALLKRLGLEEQITPIREEYRGARVVRAARLVPIPEDFRLFTPTSIRTLITSGVFSPLGIARAAMEPFIPARRTTDDESLGSFVTRRFGREVLDRLAQPLIGGIYSGDPQHLSMQSTLPQMLRIERTYGSLVRGMRFAARSSHASISSHRLVSLRNGLETLVIALERELREAIRTSSNVTQLRRRAAPDNAVSWQIALSDGSEIEADAVICALPAHASAQLLQGLEPRLAQMLRGIRYHSVATVNLAFASKEIPELPRCTGFVVPYVEGRKILATTFSSQKYAHRAAEGYTLLRAFVGGALQPLIVALDDAEVIDAVRTEFRELLGIAAEPRFSIVRRWPDALPEYALGHMTLVGKIEDAAAKIGRFALAGSAYGGVGIADCVRSGEAAAAATFTASLPISGASTAPSFRVGASSAQGEQQLWENAGGCRSIGCMESADRFGRATTNSAETGEAGGRVFDA